MTHDGTMIIGLSSPEGRRVICSCGWVGDWVANEDIADADFCMHQRLSEDRSEIHDEQTRKDNA